MAEGEYWKAVTDEMMGDILGIMLVTPLVLIFYFNQYGFTLQRRKVEFVLFLLAAFSFEQLSLFGNSNYRQTIAIDLFWMFLLMIFTALRLGRHGVVIGLLVILGSCVWQLGNQHSHQIAYLNYWLYHVALNICSTM